MQYFFLVSTRSYVAWKNMCRNLILKCNAVNFLIFGSFMWSTQSLYFKEYWYRMKNVALLVLLVTMCLFLLILSVVNYFTKGNLWRLTCCVWFSLGLLFSYNLKGFHAIEEHFCYQCKNHLCYNNSTSRAKHVQIY